MLSAVALAAQLLIKPLFQVWRGYPVVIAATLTALLAGFGPGLVALLLSNVAVVLLYLREGSPVAEAVPFAQLALLDVATIFVLLFIHRTRRAEEAAERMRSERTRMLETVANTAPVMVWVSGTDKLRTFFNEGWLSFTGRTREAEHGNGWTDGIHPDDREHCLATWINAFERREPFKVEYRLRRRDGEFRWLLDQGTPRFDSGGVFDGYIGSCVDIDDMKTALDDRRTLLSTIDQERERLQNIMSNVPGVVWEAWGSPDESEQRIDFVSDHVVRMLGYTVNEWLATPNFWLTIVHPDDREQAARNAAEHFAAGGTRTNSFRWITRDGRAIDVESQATVIADADGQPLGMRGVTMDITARKRAEDSLKFLARASDVLASSLDYETTIATAVRLALPTLADLCIVDLLSEDGKSIRRLAAAHARPENAALADELLDYPPALDGPTATSAALRTGKPYVNNHSDSQDVAARVVDAHHAELVRALGMSSYLAVPMEARGRLLGALLFTSEQSNRYDAMTIELAVLLARRAAIAVDNAQLYRGAVNASHARDEFLATVSHELRTPMTATLGWVRLLALGQLDPETQTLAIQSIERSTQAQARLIDDILDVSSITLGKFTLHADDVDPSLAVEAAISAVRPAIAAKKMSIDVDVSGWSGTVRADPARLQQILWNLLSNAIKFGREDGHVHVSLVRSESTAEITVSDDGAGIDEKMLPRVFERFWQAESGTTRSYGGLGLGLAIVRHLVELHGGTVRAESAGRGHGARFVVSLPIGATPFDGDETRRRRASPVSNAAAAG